MLVCAAFLAAGSEAGGAAHPEGVTRLLPDRPQDGDSVLQVGEELTYNVSYASIDLGQLRFRITGTSSEDHARYYTATASINSYRGIPFVNLHATYETVMGEGAYSRRFEARHRHDEHWRTVRYDFDYRRRLLLVDRGIWKRDTVTGRDTLALDTLSQDGLSILYTARRFVHAQHQLRLPSYVNEKRGITQLDLPGERASEKIDAIGYPIDLIHIEGKADFVGIYGLTGSFEGWFSNDAACVPILANMKVLIGNIRIELVSWKREGWTPPRSVGEKGE